MRKLLVLSFIFSAFFMKAQSAADAAVQLTVSAQANPAKITLGWPGNGSTSQYQVFRKLKTDLFWGAAIATLNGSTNQYADTSVTKGISYEYRVTRAGAGYTGYGYVNAGIEVPEIFYRGKLILIVDSTFISTLASELSRLTKDIEGDGWDVIRHDVLRNGSVTHVKDLIKNDFMSDTINTRAVFLFGHVPVPYSGMLNPDGHSDHYGAWPADVYYADMHGTWTDALGPGASTASPARTQNYPGDGKFDQTVVPGNVDLQVGRVDLANLSTFTLTEQQLLINYLDKDHDYRKKNFTPLKRAVIDDNFGYFGSEAFAASGFKNFAPLVGTSNILSADYFTSMTGNSYQWSYGCGGGTYVSAGGVGNTSNFAASSLDGVFTMLFGSYFGDWDCTNNFLRAPLAQGKVLTSVWSGRPHYQFHHMALGENIGYSLMLTQNNPGNLYFGSPTSITGKWVHNALMGDPTLRNDVLAPVSNVIATKAGNNCHISWSASTETALAGYNIYVKNDSQSVYVKLNASPVATTNYTHQCLLHKGIYTYLVRAIKLESTPSGSYYNMSEGISDTAMNTVDLVCSSAFTAAVIGNTVTLSNTSSLSTNYFWDFDNGQTSTMQNPVVVYSSNGLYNISLIASNSCYSDTSYSFVNILEVSLDEKDRSGDVFIYPNPAKDLMVLEGLTDEHSVTFINSAGSTVLQISHISGNKVIDVSALPKGLYLAVISGREGKVTKKIILE